MILGRDKQEQSKTYSLCEYFNCGRSSKISSTLSTLSEVKNDKYEDIIYHLRVRLRFAILRSTLMAVRGQGGKKLKGVDGIEETSFNLIPEGYNQRFIN